MALYPEIFEAVKDAIPSASCAPEAILFGEEHVAAQGAPPRIVWVPGSDGFSPPQARGSGRGDEHAIHGVKSSVDVHLWGASTADAYALRDAFVRALRDALGVNYALTGGRILPQKVNQEGAVYILSVAISSPITTGPVTVATPTTGDQSDVSFSVSPPH